ncbi:hypothetical protein Ddye_024039, partial [Dipteronia dyeriana]
MVGQEDNDHVFRNCSNSKCIWEDICKGSTASNSYNAEWNNWLFDNLKCYDLIGGHTPWNLLFAVTLWFIWKWRCEKIFYPNFVLPLCPGKIILRYVGSWLFANAKLEDSVPEESRMISWEKLIVDGSWLPELGSIAMGGVNKNDRKSWLVGFALNKGTGSVIEAELWGILVGLNFAWNAGFRKVDVESDSKVVF